MRGLEGLRFRNFVPGDLEHISRFKKESSEVSFPGSDIDLNIFKKKILEAVDRDDNYVKIAEMGGEIAGYVYFEIRNSITGRTGCINHIFVRRKYRESGLGRKLMSVAEDYLKSKGITRVRATVTKTNHASLGFCLSLGYREKRLILEKPLN